MPPPRPSTSVVLIGFMGSGKTEIGRMLAERLGYEFVDTDALIESSARSTIPQIFKALGEEGLRALERTAVIEAAAKPGRVIACGGGTILSVRNYGVLKGVGPIIYLRTSVEELIARLGEGEGRPLLNGDPAENVPRLLSQRAPAYESAAEVIVDTDGRTPTDVADEIVKRLG
ncbi:MAG: shikimate kinase [Actinomycetota bacterium]